MPPLLVMFLTCGEEVSECYILGSVCLCVFVSVYILCPGVALKRVRNIKILRIRPYGTMLDLGSETSSCQRVSHRYVIALIH